MPKPFPLHHSAQRLIARAPKGLVAFLSVGVTGLAVHMALVGLLSHLFMAAGLGGAQTTVHMAHEPRFNPAQSLAWWIALAVATFVTWRLNRRFTFASSGRASGSEIRRYILVTLVAQGISFSVFTMVGAFFAWFPPSLAVLPGAVVATLFSYTGQRFFTFSAPNVEAAVVPEIPVI
jgi:putative flippase GtrA